ncbi:very short patch repair endonuclease [Paenibacillus polymyxa]|uniref:very short patch repair endonuclease n=1 Tax=Paenibacillus TaxID=44249 RepID=UPI0007EAC98A|nr:very short patch repair endonuclease [Paenibacillus polymyxa]OBA03966.1 very short patch repair endonuclease [Paenibacillus polymyxa]ODB55038.1 very short patch repair endonuclease [Paenibacillus polymyxa]
MSDVVSKEKRSEMMAGIKSVSKLENRVASELWKKGLRFRRNDKSLPGKPDISIKKYKLVIFIDSCFWHQCPLHSNIPKNNREFWKKKLLGNVERDKKVTGHYVSSEWKILRIWEHDFKTEFDKTVSLIADFIIRNRKSE